MPPELAIVVHARAARTHVAPCTAWLRHGMPLALRRSALVHAAFCALAFGLHTFSGSGRLHAGAQARKQEENMAITRWDPFRELESVTDRLNRVFGRSVQLGDLPRDSLALSDWSPAVDVAETPEEYVVKAELPEVRKEDIKVTVDGGVLRLSGERSQEKEEKNKRFHRVERSYGSFARSFVLPDTVDEAKLQAEFKDGLLTVHLPKAAQPKPKTVDVKVS